MNRWRCCGSCLFANHTARHGAIAIRLPYASIHTNRDEYITLSNFRRNFGSKRQRFTRFSSVIFVSFFGFAFSWFAWGRMPQGISADAHGY